MLQINDFKEEELQTVNDASQVDFSRVSQKSKHVSYYASDNPSKTYLSEFEMASVPN